MAPDEQDPPRSDDIEGRLRRVLRDGRSGVDPQDFLDDVHRGARGRRRRRAAGGVLGTAAVVAVAAYAVSAAGIFDTDATPAADDRTPTVTTRGSVPVTSDATVATPAEVANKRALSLSATGTDHQYVLAAGKFGCSDGCLRAYTTDDAGASFQETAPLGLLPSDPDPTSDTAYDIRFADEDNGWVFGGGLRSTHDGGASWSTPVLPVDGIVSHLEPWGDRVYAAVDDRTTDTATLVRSDSTGDDWQTLDVGAQLRLISQLAVSERVTAVLATQSRVSNDNQILLSGDDGTSWSDVSPCTGDAWPSSVSTSATSLWTVCTGNNDATAYVSTDDGQRWTSTQGTFAPGSAVQARDETTAAVLDSGRPGVTLVTVDGPPQHTLADAGFLLPIGFTNPTTGYLRTTDDAILRTVDSGATWQPYPLP